jgi:uncharacterized protein
VVCYNHFSFILTIIALFFQTDWIRTLVTHSRFPFRINVGFSISLPIGSSREIPFDLPEVSLDSDLIIKDFSGILTVHRAARGLLLEGHFKGALKAECVRCLSDFLQPIDASFEELYAFHADEVDETGLLVPETFIIDIEPLIRDYFLLEFPFTPVCKPDCKGLCIECGVNLNTSSCEHSQL